MNIDYFIARIKCKTNAEVSKILGEKRKIKREKAVEDIKEGIKDGLHKIPD